MYLDESSNLDEDELQMRMQGKKFIADIPPLFANKEAAGFMHRLLNHLPGNRIVATALDAFLKVAGYKLHLTYRGQLLKLVQYVGEYTLSDLDRQGDHEARAVHARLETYLQNRAYEVEPEGRTLPESDLSSLERA